jgi:agmatine deiminase
VDESSASGLRMPPEWAPHDLSLIAWPEREEAWRGTTIEAARDSHAEVVAALSQFERVVLVVDPSSADEARSRVPESNVEVVAIPIDDSWLRDSGPIFVTGDGRRAGVDFEFNAWGEAFSPYDRDRQVASGILRHLGIDRIEGGMVLEGGAIAVDGEGLLATTEQCLLNPNRNPGMNRGQVEERLRSMLGVDRFAWLGDGLAEDADTDGHVDNVCAFFAPGKALVQTVEERSDPNYTACRENVRRLEAAGVEVVEMELLPRIARDDGAQVVVPYMNYYVANGAVIVPVGGIDPDMDDEALERIGRLYPGREVVGVDGRTLALGGGGIHCITQQVPEAPGPGRSG